MFESWWWRCYAAPSAGLLEIWLLQEVAGSKIRSAWRSPGFASALRSKTMHGAGGPMCDDHAAEFFEMHEPEVGWLQNAAWQEHGWCWWKHEPEFC